MPTLDSVLFDARPIRTEHAKTVEMLFKPLEVPEGGPWCVCSLKAICALKSGNPESCSDMPWHCPFASRSRCTPTL